METKRLTLILSFLFIMGNIVRADKTFRKFTQNVVLYSIVCSIQDQLFHEESMRKIQCLSLCADNSSCFAVFHDKVRQHCVGCRVLHSSGTNQLIHGMFFILYFHHKYTVVTEFKTYDQAKAHCQEIGAHLAYINSFDEQNFIERQVIGAYTSNFWIGASRRSDGVIYWEDNTTVAMTSTGMATVSTYTGDNYENWADGEPNALSGEDCIILHYPSQWTWHDDNCDYLHLSLCEF
ncbi:macrophage mannose receptor 1-like [Ruditapes philippinarum]|uniref:macrophage mannose receptor 1-like n=1 Tax=Ruditapes philippinarum TaxID=129788 RepID=UPI00295BE16F|nr:macrophage mannose receptor 1-like [Ruditapes philippinarum]